MDIIGLLFFFVILVPSSIFHEYMHGWVANQLGDPTAKLAGRLTLNPIVHIDMFGTLLLPALLFFASGGNFLFAYAKPVPFNPYNLRWKKWGPAAVGIAGPLANLLVALIFGVVSRYLPDPGMVQLAHIIVYANVLLAVFNLVPIPPLDGSKVLFALLPPSMQHVQKFMERWGIVLLFAFIFIGFDTIAPVIGWLTTLFVGLG